MSPAEKKIGYRDVFTQKEYLKVILANLISRFGDAIDAIALVWLIYQITGSAAWSAIMFGVNRIPSIVVQPFTGVLVERLPKKMLMVATDIMRGLVVVGLAVLYVGARITPGILIEFTLLISTVEAFRMPAGIAIIPLVMDTKYYAYGSSLNQTCGMVTELIGTGIAGGIIAFFGVQSAILIDAATFIISALVLSQLKVKEKIVPGKKGDIRWYLTDLKDGFQYLKESKIIRNFTVMGILVNAATVPINALQSPIAEEIFGGGSEMLSIMGIFTSAGMILGSLVFPKLQERSSIGTMLTVPGMVVGVAMAAYTLGLPFKGRFMICAVIAAFVSFILSIACSMVSGAASVGFVKSVESSYLARVSAIFNALVSLAMPMTSFIIGVFAKNIATSTILLVFGGLCVILFLIIKVTRMKFE